MWQIWRLNPRKLVVGPVFMAGKAVQQLGWTWEEPFVFTRTGRPPLRILEMSKGAFLREVRESVREAELFPLAGGARGFGDTTKEDGSAVKACRREDMRGIAARLGYQATTNIL